jgi:hypothetical protein
LKSPPDTAVKQPIAVASAPRAALARSLGAEFFARPALSVAKGLIGKYLVRRQGDRQTAAVITETEA